MFKTWGEKYYFDKGINKGKLTLALALIDDGMAIDKVVKLSGLPKEKILDAR